jgi:succinate dehydrogenase / fumarate reductase iron-sulfur subunit
MTQAKWTVTLKVFRQKHGSAPHYDDFTLEVSPDEYVLDAIERIWAFHDRSLCYRHACHHSVCGACGMRVNGVEKLTCITPIRSVTRDGGTLKIDPLRNFPVVSDLTVDMSTFYSRMELVRQRSVLPVDEAGIEGPLIESQPLAGQRFFRLSDCIECGMCISACPISTTTPAYLGPAVLAGAQQTGIKADPELLPIVDHEDGLWRCHSAFECTAVCPSYVEPGWRIMDLRKQVIGSRIRQLFGLKP